MPAFTTYVAVAGLLVAGAGAASAESGRKESKKQLDIQANEQKTQGAEQRKQYEAQQRIADIRNARERADFVRKATFARAQIVNNAALGGTSQSSGAAGGLAGLDTASASGLGGFGATQGNQADIFASQTRQGESVVRAGVAGAALSKSQLDTSAGQALQGVGQSMFTDAGGYKTIFDAAKKA